MDVISSFPAIFLSCVKKNSHILYKRGNCSGHRKRAVLCIIFLSEYPKATVILTIPLTSVLGFILSRFSVEMERVINIKMFEFWVRVEPNYSYPLKEFSLEKSEGFQSLIFFLSTNPNIRTKNIQDKLL